jgi:addiction module HigA family antidote
MLLDIRSYKIVEGKITPSKRIATHPSVILLNEPLVITQNALAIHLDVFIQRINEYVSNKLGVTSETIWFISELFNTTPEFWLNLQSVHD